MLLEDLDKTIIPDSWQIFSKKIFQHFFHHKKILKVIKFQFKIICRSRVLNKNILLWYIVPFPFPDANRVKSNLFDYLDTYIFVTGNITAIGGDVNS